jgi:hypothetical protein
MIYTTTNHDSQHCRDKYVSMYAPMNVRKDIHMSVIGLGTLLIDILQYWDCNAPDDWMIDGLQKVWKVVVVE